MLSSLESWLFNPVGLTPHGFCLLWQPGLIWTYAGADAATGLAYVAISLALAVFAHLRRGFVFRPILWCFAAFVLLCGAGHWLDLLTLWVPAYRVEGLVKVATAAVSVVTAVLLWRLLPQALLIPSSAQLARVNAALLDSEARHRASFERSPVPLYTLDDGDLVVDVSDSWLALLGYTRSEVVGRSIRGFQVAASAASIEADRQRLLCEGELREAERRFVRRDGTIVEALVSARLEQREGAVWVVCALIDVTARKRAEQALRISEERLYQAQKMEAVGQLTGGVAHDFNNMLQGIVGALGVMERRVGQGRTEDVVRYIGLARQTVDRAATLTHRMLAFARRQALQPRAVEPDLLIEGMEVLVRHTVGPAVTLNLCLHDGWLILCDPGQLESALLNLAINARDAMPDGGTLTIATADRHLTAAELDDAGLADVQGEAAPSDYIEIAVTDTGTGMSADVRARAFEPFYTTKAIGRGTGLGLSQLYGFVRQSGGSVRIESEPGRGTTVRVFLPRTEHADAAGWTAATGDAVPDRDEYPAELAGRTVLVVDDEPDVRATIAETLREAGFRVLEGDDGPAGLRVLESGEPVHMLVSDVGLPGLNGRKLADAARAQRPALPVLLVTGYAGTALEEVGLEPGMDIVFKPVDPRVLAVKVRTMLARKEQG